MRLFAPFIAALVVSGCGFIYKLDVQQGNYVTQEMVAKLKKGMTKPQVMEALGTPLLADAFHANRWDYYFSNVKGGKAADRTRLSVFFEDDKLVAVTGDVRAAAPTQSAPTATAPPAAAPSAVPRK